MFSDSSMNGSYNGTQTTIYEPKTCVADVTTADGPGDEFGNNTPYLDWCAVGFPSPTVTLTQTTLTCRSAVDGTVVNQKSLSSEYTTDMLKSHLAELIGATSVDSLEWNQAAGVTYDSSGVPASSTVDIFPPEQLAFRHIADSEGGVSEQVAKYRLRLELGEYCLGDGSLVFRWREIFIPDDEEAEPTINDREQTVTPSEMEGEGFEAISGEYSLSVPEGEYGTWYLAGPSTLAQAGLLIYSQGASARKRGFLEYQPSTTPRVYLTESASGSFAGCPASEIPSRSYSGTAQYTETSSVGCFSFSSSFSYYASLYRSPRYPSESEAFWFDYAPIKTQPEILSATSRRWQAETSCDGEPVTDQITMTLSNEFTTADLIASVNEIVSTDWEDSPQYNCLGSWSNCALNYLSPDETFFARCRIRYSLSASISWAFTTEKNFTFKIRKTTTNLDTGEVSESDISVPVTFDAGETSKTVDPVEIEAPEGNSRICLSIIPEDQPSHEMFSATSPEACWANTPRDIADL